MPLATHAAKTGQDGLTFDGNPRRQYVFAYGSDMFSAQIMERCSRPVLLAVACLADQRLGFFGHSDIWDGGVETVVPAPGQELWGVIYELTFTDAQRLDVWHDARLDGAGSFFHYPARVLDTAGQPRTVLLYKKDILGAQSPPSRQYLEVIIQGAKERGLPADYIEGLRAVPAKEASYPVPDRSEFQREIRVVTNCSECGS